MTPAERNELLHAIDECAAQARHLADAYGLPAMLLAVTKLHDAADLVESA
jgi:hypothetical protein